MEATLRIMKCGLVIFLSVVMATSLWAQPKNPNEILLETTMVSEISFKQTSLSAVLEYFTQKASDKHPLNFVPLYPPEYGEKLITLQLSQVPLKVVLDYVGKLAGVQFIPERHAIRVIALGSDERVPINAAGSNSP